MFYLLKYGYKLTFKNYIDLYKIFICIDNLENYFNEYDIKKIKEYNLYILKIE